MCACVLLYVCVEEREYLIHKKAWRQLFWALVSFTKSLVHM